MTDLVEIRLERTTVRALDEYCVANKLTREQFILGALGKASDSEGGATDE